jgi:hypothetical protein
MYEKEREREKEKKSSEVINETKTRKKIVRRTTLHILETYLCN